MGDTVQWVDFEKLQIANAKSFQRLDDTNKELINSKLKANIEKRKFQKQLDRLDRHEKASADLVRKILRKTEQIKVLQSDRTKLDTEIELLNERLLSFRRKMSDFSAPSIRQYIDLTRENEQLRSKLKIVQRKSKLARNWHIMNKFWIFSFEGWGYKIFL